MKKKIIIYSFARLIESREVMSVQGGTGVEEKKSISQKMIDETLDYIGVKCIKRNEHSHKGITNQICYPRHLIRMDSVVDIVKE